MGTREADGTCPHSANVEFGLVAWAKAEAKEQRVCKADLADGGGTWCFGACSGQVTAQTENYGSSLKWSQKGMALASGWEQGKRTGGALHHYHSGHLAATLEARARDGCYFTTGKLRLCGLFSIKEDSVYFESYTTLMPKMNHRLRGLN